MDTVTRHCNDGLNQLRAFHIHKSVYFIILLRVIKREGYAAPVHLLLSSHLHFYS
jgi:hypothetical protein